MSVRIINGDARDLPLEDGSVDLIVTSPPYFALRSYQDGGEHYAGQVGSEATPVEFVDALIECTREMVRVLKPSGSIFVNLGDKYGDKSLIGIPWRYALRCIDDLGLILRAEIIWSKPNGLPESVTDRVRRSHETWFHSTVQPRYFSAVDEIREQYAPGTAERYKSGYRQLGASSTGQTANGVLRADDGGPGETNPLGKLPGSVWTIPTQPLTVPDHLGIDHFAAFPTEWPKRIIAGWSPAEVCTACGEGRRPVVDVDRIALTGSGGPSLAGAHGVDGRSSVRAVSSATITGYACACPDTSAPSTPGVVLDPFGGTGTTALVAHALGRVGISNDMSADYCRLAEWRTSDRGELARVLGVAKPPVEVAGQADLFGDGDEAA